MRICVEKDCDKIVHAKDLCRSHYTINWQRNPEVRERRNSKARIRYDSKKESDRHLKKTYKITRSQWNFMFKLQDGKCLVCGTDEPGDDKGWHVHHDHKCCPSQKTTCGKCIIGILCKRCNTGLGFFNDDPELLSKALQVAQQQPVDPNMPRIGYLRRNADISGISGTGNVAWLVEFPDGTAVLRWHADANGAPHCTSLWESVDDIVKIHGHEGATEVVYERLAGQ